MTTSERSPSAPDDAAGDSLNVSEHVRSAGSTIDAGVYRVVGVDDAGVRLLMVGDEEGGRLHTGIVVDVDRETAGSLSSAPNPDDGFDRIGFVLLLVGVSLVLGVVLGGIAPLVGVDEGALLTVAVLLAVLGALRLRH